MSDESTIRHLRVRWRHHFAEEPIILISEVVDGREVRKVEVYRDGRIDYADQSVATGSTMLSTTAFPDLEEIAAQDEFMPESITSEEFEQYWRAACTQAT